MAGAEESADFAPHTTGNSGVVQASHEPSHDHPASLLLTLPPLATIVLRAG